MPLSTSSSRVPRGSWWAFWISTLLLSATLLTVWEVMLRSHGFGPNLRDDSALWSVTRVRASDLTPPPLVLIGGSRMQLDVDPRILGDELNRRVLQLAIDGSSPLPVLADLADDESFRGDVWVSLRVENLFGLPHGRSHEYLTHFWDVPNTWNSRWNTTAGAAIDSRLACRSGITSLRALISRSLPTPVYTSMRTDRYKSADYTLPDRNRLRASRVYRCRERYAVWKDSPPSPAVFEKSLTLLQTQVEAIQRRGGHVTLIRLPTGPVIRGIAESVFPRDTFWNRLAAQSTATVLHFEDEPSLASFTLPDESHLDFRDAPAFTRALLTALSAD